MLHLRSVLRLAAGLVLAMVGSFSAVAAPLRQAPTPATLRVTLPVPQTLDPVQLSRFDLAARDLAENLFVGLTRYNPATGESEPMLAKSWTVSPDGLRWTFELRDDIQWVRYDRAAGSVTALRPVTAGDLVYAVQRACDPTRPSPVTANLMVVKGCLTVANAFPQVIDDLFIAREIAVRATSSYTLEIDLAYPASFLPALLSTPEFRPLAREAVGDNGGEWAVPETIITSGPFALQSWTASGLTLVRNPHWPDAPGGNVEQVEVTFSGSAPGAPADFARVPADDLAAARASNPALVHTVYGNSVVLLGFSYERTPVNVTEVRRALARAINPAALLAPNDAAYPAQGLAVPAPGTASEPGWFDPAQAQASFSAAGYPACANLPEPLTLFVPDDDPRWLTLGQAIAQQWSAALGCNAALFTVETLERPLLIELAHSAYDPEKITRSHLWLAVWSADYPDANAWLYDTLHCHYGYIRTGRECDQADAWLDQAATEMDPARRAELYAQVEDALFGPAGSFPVIPLYFSAEAYLQQPWLSGVNERGAARFDLWTIDTEQQP